MQKDVILIVVNGNPLFVPTIGDETLADLGQCALAGLKYADADLGRWQFFTPKGEELPKSMPVRELTLADDFRPDLFLNPRAGVAA